MSLSSSVTPSTKRYGILLAGSFIGLAGGLAEIVVVWLYSAMTGGDAAMVAREVASAVGLERAPAMTGVAVHMALAVALGIFLIAALQILADRSAHDRLTSSLLVGSLAVVWVINYFVVLPAISPSFVHLLPYAVTLASKLAFGLAAAATLNLLPAPKPARARVAANNTQVGL